MRGRFGPPRGRSRLVAADDHIFPAELFAVDNKAREIFLCELHEIAEFVVEVARESDQFGV
ncbi:hypothetical protein D3C86_2196180 [compost metagenome]